MSEREMKDNLKEELQRIAERKKAAQAYLLEDTDSAALLKLAGEFAKMLGASEADTIEVYGEKPNLISVADVREKLVKDVYIRPYDSPVKVYIVPHAEDMNVQAQNALLKTLEEPPQYVVILLLTGNSEAFLPTILSRCVKLSSGASDRRDGSGQEEEAEAEALSLVDGLFRGVASLSTEKEIGTAAALAKKKQFASSILDRFELWYRDILLMKMGGNKAPLVLQSERSALSYLAGKMRYEGIGAAIRETENTRSRLTANVNTDISFEVLVMALRKAM